ncbi:hypothetical protein [Natrialba aegyptia]|uniref:hypothetical protein n=1 Tax=Natrialba aegyptia TaxID=129789 RepID=UPI00403A85AA
MAETPELTARQKEFIAHLPSSTPALADRLGIETTSVESIRNAIRDKDIGLEYDREANQWFLADERAPKLRRVSTKHKGTKTREANELIEAEESVLLRRLRRTDPLQTPAHEDPGVESFVAVLSDLHFGDLVEDDRGNVVYDVETARACVETFTEKCLQIRGLEEQYTRFDDAHLFLLGDMVTGEGIYEGQVHDLEAFLADQVTESVEALYELAVTLADAFETLHIHCVLGNHGQVRASGVSRQANCDLIAYRWLDDALRRDAVDNVSMEVAEATHHLNTEVRGWRVHCRHGQDGQTHVDKTAASSRDWRGWREAHRFDIAMRGHYHTPSLDWVLNRYPVVSAPSPKPGSEFIERLGSPDVSERKHLGWAFGVGDSRPMTFKRLIDDR